MNDPRWQAATNLLLIRLDNLGDVLVTTPAIRAVRAALPDARLTLLASLVGAQAGHLNPDLDDVIVYQAPWMDPWHQLPQDPAREQAIIATLREHAFDGAVIFTSFRQSALPAAYLCYLAGIPLRAAASIDGPGSLLTTRHKHPDKVMHEVERGLDLVGAIGFPLAADDLVLSVPESDRATACELLARHGSGRPNVVVHPGCSMPARTYPWEGFGEAAALLAEELGATVFVTGANDEAPLIRRIVAAIPATLRHRILGFAGELSFGQFCALIEQSDLVVTNNTGPMHVAAALKTPVVALFALTNPPEQWGPWRVPHRILNHDVPCRLCYSRVCPTTHDCLRLVTPAEILDAARDLLSTPGRSALAASGREARA